MTVFDDLPSTIQVGAHEWSVVVDSQREWQDVMGETDTAKQEISINPANPKGSVIAATLLHELLHVIWSQSGLGKRPKEEQVVIAYENGLASVIKDNPGLIKFFRKYLGKE